MAYLNHEGHRDNKTRIMIALHLVACRESQVAKHGDLFAVELAAAKEYLAKAMRGEVDYPQGYVAQHAWNVRVKSAKLLGYDKE